MTAEGFLVQSGKYTGMVGGKHSPAVDAIIGDPDRIWRRIPHPVAWFGGLIDAQGADAFNTIFIALVVFAVLGCICLVMTRRAMKKNAAAEAESAN